MNGVAGFLGAAGIFVGVPLLLFITVRLEQTLLTPPPKSQGRLPRG